MTLIQIIRPIRFAQHAGKQGASSAEAGAQATVSEKSTAEPKTKLIHQLDAGCSLEYLKDVMDNKDGERERERERVCVRNSELSAYIYIYIYKHPTFSY